MAPRTLKETYARKKSSEFVESAIAIHGSGIGLALTEKLSQELREGEVMPDITLFLELMARRMGRFRTQLLERAAEHFQELAADAAFRKARDEAMADLTRVYIATRQTVALGYSPEDAATLGFEPNVATDPAQMELQVQRLLANFAKPEAQELRPVITTVQFVPAEGETMFRPHLDKLITARAGLNRDKRKADETLMAKNDAVTVNDQEFGQISRCIETAFAFAGREDLARRVRPSTRRLGRRQEVEDGDEGDSSLPPETAPPEGPANPPTTPAPEAGTTQEDQETGAS
jgi:hypothetical protein